MAELRLFSAAFPWQCELQNTKGSWSFGTSNADHYRLPNGLFAEYQSILETATLFSLKQSPIDHWEIENNGCGGQEGRPKIPSKLNGQSYVQATLNDGDIITLGARGHIFVEIKEELKKGEPLLPSKVDTSDSSLESKGEARESASQADVNTSVDSKKPASSLRMKSPKERISQALSSSEERKRVDLALVGKKAELKTPLPGKRFYLQKLGFLSLLIFLGGYFFAKGSFLKNDLGKEGNSTIHSSRFQLDSQLSSDSTLNSGKIENLGRAQDQASQKLVKNENISQIHSPTSTLRADTWPTLIKSPSAIVEQMQNRLMRRIDLSASRLPLTGENLYLHEASLLNQSDTERSDQHNELPSLDLASQKRAKLIAEDERLLTPTGFRGVDWSVQLQILLFDDGFLHWLRNRWHQLAPAVTVYPKFAERAMLSRELRRPLGPPISQLGQNREVKT